MESVFYITEYNRNHRVYFWAPIQTQPFLGAWQRVFSGRPGTHKASSDCFRNVSEHRMLPLSLCVFQTVTNELLIEFINNMASGWKMMRWRGRRQRQREETGGGGRLDSKRTRKDGDPMTRSKKKVIDNLVINHSRCYLLNSTPLTLDSSTSVQLLRLRAVFARKWRLLFSLYHGATVLQPTFRVWLRKRLPHVTNTHPVVFSTMI